MPPRCSSHRFFSLLSRSHPESRRPRTTPIAAIEQCEERKLLTALFGQYPGTWGNDGPVVQMNGQLFFPYQRDDTGMELYKSDGTPGGTVLVKDLENVGGNSGSYPKDLTVVNNTLFFSAYTNGNDFQLYKTDGTGAGTIKLSTAAGATLVTKVGSKVFFVANSGSNTGAELHVSDGTQGGTHLVKDIYPGINNSGIKAIGDLNGIAIFLANDGVNSIDLWRSDGTDAGTYRIKDLGAVNSSVPKFFGMKDGKLYFKFNENIAYFTDGTEAGTGPGDIPDSLNTDIEYTPGTGNTYFYTIDRSLYYFNGTSVVTLRTAPPGEFQANLAFANGYLFFAAKNENGIELWRSDGTVNGTAMLKDIRTTPNNAASSYPINLKAIGNTVFFAANEGVNGFELWKTNGTPEGTLLVANMAPGSQSSNPARMTEFNGQLVLGTFETYGLPGNSTDGVAYWKSDGTTNGTVMFAGNHAPEMTAAGNPIFNPINQNISSTLNTGTLVKDMLTSLVNTGGSLTDFDANALQGIAIVGVNNTSGVWQFSTDNGTNWFPIQGANQQTLTGSPLMLAADNSTRIRYQPNPGTTGTVGITFHAWDRSAFTNGTNGFLNTGRFFSLSTVAESAYITVNPVTPNPATFGVFRGGTFYLDASRNRKWDGTAGGDAQFGFAAATDIPIAGDWNGDGKTDIGVFRNGSFYLDYNGSRTWDGTAGGDLVFGFGNSTDTPITGDWNGDGRTDIGVWRNGVFYLDQNGNFRWDGIGGGDAYFGFGGVSDIPITGDWNGDGFFDVGVFRAGTFYLDQNGNRNWNGPTGGDAQFGFAAATDTPITGDWNGDGKTDVGVWRAGTFYIDLNGDQRWNGTNGGDFSRGFGSTTDIPLVGTWGPQNVNPSIAPKGETLASLIATGTGTTLNKKKQNSGGSIR